MKRKKTKTKKKKKTTTENTTTSNQLKIYIIKTIASIFIPLISAFFIVLP